ATAGFEPAGRRDTRRGSTPGRADRTGGDSSGLEHAAARPEPAAGNRPTRAADAAHAADDRAAHTADDRATDAADAAAPRPPAGGQARLGLRRQEPRPHGAAERRSALAVLNPTTPTLHEAPATAEQSGKQVAGGLDILSRRVRREVERQISPHESVLFCLRGSLNHSLVALNERLIIGKPGLHAGPMWGSLTTTFYYQDVTGIQLHTFIMSGWIEVSSPSFQGRERKRNRHPRTSDRDVYKLPNCVPLAKRRVDEYYGALAQLRERIELSKRPL